MVAKRFFYVCAGLLCLALAYHLGARSAGAQLGATIEGAGIDRGTASVAVNRVVYRAGTSGGIGQMACGTPVPGTSPILATSAYQEVWAITADGKGYVDSGACSWRLAADFGALGTVPVEGQSWGSVKARYRQGAGAAMQDK